MKNQPSTCQFFTSASGSENPVQCGKPLGSESKDAGWTLCREHRSCLICGLELKPIDSYLAYEKFLEDPSDGFEPAHSRCLIASRRLEHLDSDPTLSIKQSTFNLLNAARLMVDPDMNLSIQTNENNAMLRSREFCESLLTSSNPPGTTVDKMQFDAVYTHQKMLEACLAAVSLLVAKQDRPAIKARADAREAIAYKRAQLEAKTSSRPTPKLNPVVIENEGALAQFMETFGIKERKTGLDLKKKRDKMVETFLKLNMPMTDALQMADKALLDGRSFSSNLASTDKKEDSPK